MNISEIKQMVSKDITLNETQLDIESLKTPQIHNKYLVILMEEKLILEKMYSELKIMKRDKWLYYTGKMGEDDLKKHNWEPFPLNILKTDIDKFLQSDSDVHRIEAKIILQKEKVNYLEEVIKIVSNRQWNIRAALDWIKFTQGQ